MDLETHDGRPGGRSSFPETECMMQEFELPYGRGNAKFALDDKVPVRVLTGKKPESDAPPLDVIRHAMENPIGTPHLWEIINHTDRVVVAIPDITRKAHQNIVVPEIIYALTKYAGLPENQITLVFTGGTHRNMTDEEHRFVLGDEIVDSGITIIDHGRESETVPVGTSSFGNRIELSRIAVEADRVILTGILVAHHFAGFSGSRKSVLPGVASYETIRRNHAMTIVPGVGLEQRCWMNKTEGNPVHTEMMEAAAMLNPDFLVNIVPSAHGGLSGAVAGHWKEAWIRGTELCVEHNFVDLEKQLDLVITSSGGYPKDLNFVQCQKAINNPSRAIRDGGALILFAQGENGWGNPKMKEWCLKGDLEWLYSHDYDSYEINMNSAGRFIENVNRFNVILVTDLPKEDIEKMGAHHASSFDEALEKAFALIGTRTPETAVIMNGNVIVPQVKA